jgi:ATP-dependent HslUV protease, peptidase subunit HslV
MSRSASILRRCSASSLPSPTTTTSSASANCGFRIQSTFVNRLPTEAVVEAASTTAMAAPNNGGQQQQRRSFHSSRGGAGGGDNTYHGTTILCVRKNGKVCMMGDGMVSMGNMIVKPNAVKIQRLFPKGVRADGSNDQKATLVGFAGATADAFTLLERLEGKLDEYPGQLSRSCVELAKGWRTDKYLRRLQASLIVADESKSLEISGNGDVLEMTDGVISIGSGSPFALGKTSSSSHTQRTLRAAESSTVCNHGTPYRGDGLHLFAAERSSVDIVVNRYIFH